ncbi:MAG: hypothetical protein ACKOSQ_06790 [Planctomycetaceae bacterium]
MAAADRTDFPTWCVEPHEILGLPPDERDPVRIVNAAACRLGRLTAAGGSESAVRQALTHLIRAAREEMLRIAYRTWAEVR